MSIKHRIKIKNATVRGYQARGTSPAELRSTGPKLRPDKGSVESSALDGESARRGVPSDENEYRCGGAYRAILAMFAKHLKK